MEMDLACTIKDEIHLDLFLLHEWLSKRNIAVLLIL
jgi:hypothetical protein